MRVTTTTCDICGKLKGEVNHWYTLNVGGGSFELIPGVGLGKTYDICGQACATSALSKWMANELIQAITVTKAPTI